MIDLLFDTPGNPRPTDGRSGHVVTTDGRRLRYAVFPADRAAFSRGTILILTGRNECIERYFETIGDLASRGFACVTFDWRGQGGSDRLIRDAGKGYVRSFQHYMRDVKVIVEDVVLPLAKSPIHVVAHSAGGLVALLAAPYLAGHVKRMVLLAPFLETTGLPIGMRGIRNLLTPLALVGLGSVYAYGGPRPVGRPPFKGNRLSTDPRRFERNQTMYELHPELGLGGPTIGWISAAAWASRAVQDKAFVDRYQLPTLIISAGADEVVSTPAIAAYAPRLPTATFLTIDGARHELLQEADAFRGQTLAAIDRFLD